LKIGIPSLGFFDPKLFALFFRELFKAFEQTLRESGADVAVEL